MTSIRRPAVAELGQHVRTCAPSKGLTGARNPGGHIGYAGFDGTTRDRYGGRRAMEGPVK